MIHGYVVDGYPKNGTQIQALEEMRMNPTIIILLECPDDVVRERLLNRKVDPLTGDFYDMKLDPPTDYAVSSRLKGLENDQPEIVDKRSHLLV